MWKWILRFVSALLIFFGNSILSFKWFTFTFAFPYQFYAILNIFKYKNIIIQLERYNYAIFCTCRDYLKSLLTKAFQLKYSFGIEKHLPMLSPKAQELLLAFQKSPHYPANKIKDHLTEILYRCRNLLITTLREQDQDQDENS